MMIAMEGPDRCGKTEISKAIAKTLNHSYFKNSGEWAEKLTSESYFKNVTTYGAPLMTELLCQVRPQIILDRYYPSEWVYSRVFNRGTNDAVLTKVDQLFADAGGRIILCRRKSYTGLKDDLHEYVDEIVLRQLDEKYAEFSEWTKCPVMTLWVDDEDLDRELKDVLQWLSL